MRSKAWLWSIVAVVTLAGVFIATQGFPIRSAAESQGVPDFGAFPASGTTIGSESAAVLVEEFFDFQCPHCQTAAEQIVYPIINKYVATGEVRFAYRFFPILGPESILAAQAASCAAEMDRFWPYQKALFEKRGTRNEGVYSRDNLVAYAEEAGIDPEELASCLDAGVITATLGEDYSRAISLGLRGTPTFIVNGRIVSPSTLAAVEEAIQEALKAGNGSAGS